jgi:glycerol kinase
MRYLLALDQGTSSSRAIVFDASLTPRGMAQKPHRQIYPAAGWVEHDPLEIWSNQRDCMGEAIAAAGIRAQDIAALGITNQRETTLLWDTRTGEPLGNAIVWQDRRTEAFCQSLREGAACDLITQKTGLPIDAYFSASKIRWVLDHHPKARPLATAGQLAFGTVDTWLIWQLTGGARHLTDVSNASRTLLFDIHAGVWDEALLDCFDIPASIMPQVLPSAADFGTTHEGLGLGALPIRGVAGDQQAALIGQGCLRPGQVKNTYGTGCFMLMHTGQTPCVSQHGLITTRAAQVGASERFALEGSVFIGGALVQWLRDELQIISTSAEIEALAQSVPDSGGVMIVPAFAGLGAPYWRSEARGSIQGLTRGSGRGHIARAALEAIALQSTALLHAIRADAPGMAVSELRVDGGACVNDLLMQMQADLMGIPICRPACIETTALGAAVLAGLGCGLFADEEALSQAIAIERIFTPDRPASWAEEKMSAWARAVERS